VIFQLPTFQLFQHIYNLYDPKSRWILKRVCRMNNLISGKRFVYWTVISINLFLAQGLAWSQTAVTPAGDGTQASPYLIAELGNLVWMSNNVSGSSGKYYTMTADIDASSTSAWNSGAGFVPIGTDSSPFLGTFDGAGRKITDLNIDRFVEENIGLFGCIGSGGVVKNIGLIDGWIEGCNDVGSLAGQNDGTITNAFATTPVTGLLNNIGGLVGINSGTITMAYATGIVLGHSPYTFIGGLVGYNFGGTVSYAHALGAVCGYSHCCIGGLIGYDHNGEVSNAFAIGSVTGTGPDSAVGGLVGYDSSSTITNTYAAGKVTATGVYSGGLIGYSQGGMLTDSYWNTETSGWKYSDGGVGKTTAEMKQQATFSGWDFTTVWSITENASYPYLRVRGTSVGTLSIDTTPLKGEIFVDGDIWNTAPQKREIAVGAHTVLFIQIEGYRTPDDQTVTVEEGKTVSVTGTYTAYAANDADADEDSFWTLAGLPAILMMLLSGLRLSTFSFYPVILRG
jgi:hypothetical protein